MHVQWIMHLLKVFKQDARLAPAYFFAQQQMFWLTFANGWKLNYCFEFGFQTFFYKQQISHWFLYFMQKKGYHDFPSKLFCFAIQKSFVVELFCAVFQKFSVIGKVYGSEGVKFHDFHLKIFDFTTKTFHRATIPGLGKKSSIKKLDG